MNLENQREYQKDSAWAQGAYVTPVNHERSEHILSVLVTMVTLSAALFFLILGCIIALPFPENVHRSIRICSCRFEGWA